MWIVSRSGIRRCAILVILGLEISACESPVRPIPDYRFEFVRADNDTTPPFSGDIDSTYYFYDNLVLFNNYAVPDSAYREYRLDSVIHALLSNGLPVKELWFQPLAGSCGDLAIPVGLELAIRLAQPDPRVYEFDFSRSGHNWWCWYNDIRHYVF